MRTMPGDRRSHATAVRNNPGIARHISAAPTAPVTSRTISAVGPKLPRTTSHAASHCAAPRKIGGEMPTSLNYEMNPRSLTTMRAAFSALVPAAAIKVVRLRLRRRNPTRSISVCLFWGVGVSFLCRTLKPKKPSARPPQADHPAAQTEGDRAFSVVKLPATV